MAYQSKEAAQLERLLRVALESLALAQVVVQPRAAEVALLGRASAWVAFSFSV
jgi:hypothetical protein